LAFHQQAADELRRNQLGGSGEEGLGEVTGGRGGYGSGLGDGWRLLGGERGYARIAYSSAKAFL